MNPADYLADAWKRLEWANGDGETLQRQIRDFRDLNPYGIWIQPDGGRWKAQHRRLIEPADETIWFEEFARLFGSFLDHSRAALNYLAVQLGYRAIRENPSLASDNLPYQQRLRPQGLEFPLFACRPSSRQRTTSGSYPTIFTKPWRRYSRTLDAIEMGCGSFKTLLSNIGTRLFTPSRSGHSLNTTTS